MTLQYAPLWKMYLLMIMTIPLQKYGHVTFLLLVWSVPNREAALSMHVYRRGRIGSAKHTITQPTVHGCSCYSISLLCALGKIH